MSKRNKRDKEEAVKPLAMRAEELADWLSDIDDSASIVRRFKLWWHRNQIAALAIEALEELADMEKKNGMHDKVRRALNTAVVAMGGAELKWQGGVAKSD